MMPLSRIPWTKRNCTYGARWRAIADGVRGCAFCDGRWAPRVPAALREVIVRQSTGDAVCGIARIAARVRARRAAQFPPTLCPARLRFLPGLSLAGNLYPAAPKAGKTPPPVHSDPRCRQRPLGGKPGLVLARWPA